MSSLPISVLIVDDSFTMRLLISDMLNSEPGINVVDMAKSGEEALAKLPTLRPNCIILDLIMPGIDGLSTLNAIMKKYPTPVIVLSAFSKKELDVYNKCLQAGAFGFIEKPSGELSLDIDKIKLDLLEKIKKTTSMQTLNLKNEILNNRTKCEKNIIVIGSSMGGPETLETIFTNLPADFKIPILVAQHIPQGIFLKNLVKRLNEKCWLNIKIIENNEPIKGGTVYCIPNGYYVSLKTENNKYLFGLNEDVPKLNSPCIDSTMISLAEHYKHNIIGIILTGMGDDGVEGMRKIKSVGGNTIVQDIDATLYGMPKAVKDANVADQILSAKQISKAIIELYSL